MLADHEDCHDRDQYQAKTDRENDCTLQRSDKPCQRQWSKNPVDLRGIETGEVFAQPNDPPGMCDCIAQCAVDNKEQHRRNKKPDSLGQKRNAREREPRIGEHVDRDKEVGAVGVRTVERRKLLAKPCHEFLDEVNELPGERGEIDRVVGLSLGKCRLAKMVQYDDCRDAKQANIEGDDQG